MSFSLHTNADWEKDVFTRRVSSKMKNKSWNQLVEKLIYVTGESLINEHSVVGLSLE